MKSLLTILVLLVSTQLLAADKVITINEGDMNMTAIRGTVSISNMYFGTCPPNALCQPAQAVMIDYKAFGCMDRVETINKVVYSADGVDIFVTALNVQNKKSLVTMCIAMPEKNEVIIVGGAMSYPDENIQVHFMGVDDNSGQ